MIIGITGTQGSGKGTVVKMLEELGFEHFSATAFITEEIERRGMPVNRDSMRTVANSLRNEHGSDYVIRSLLEQAKLSEKSIIESVRAIGEAKLLKKKGAFLLAVDASIQTRFTRCQKRGSSKDDVSFSHFEEQERKESANADETKQNISGCMELADYTIQNNGTVADLSAQVANFIDFLNTSL